MPMKEPMDRNRPATSKWESPPSAVLYSSTDLQRRKRSGALGEYHMVTSQPYCCTTFQIWYVYMCTTV